MLVAAESSKLQFAQTSLPEYLREDPRPRQLCLQPGASGYYAYEMRNLIYV